MDEVERLCLWACLCALSVLAASLARRLADLEEDMDLDKVPAGNPGSLLEAKRAIERYRIERVIGKDRMERAERSRA